MASNKKEAKLQVIAPVQDFAPDHWNWTKKEKKALGDVAKMGEIIKSRLTGAGVEVLEMYAIKHDKDEKELWDEYKNEYIHSITNEHAHFLIYMRKGDTLGKLAKIIGLEPNFIEKPKRGRYSYSNLLSYLIHIKYPKKYQYDPHDVITLAGKPYIDYYREKHDAWMRGRADVIIKQANDDYVYLGFRLMNGEITIEDLYKDPAYRTVLILHKSYFDKTMNTINQYEEMREKALRGEKLYPSQKEIEEEEQKENEALLAELEGEYDEIEEEERKESERIKQSGQKILNEFADWYWGDNGEYMSERERCEDLQNRGQADKIDYNPQSKQEYFELMRTDKSYAESQLFMGKTWYHFVEKLQDSLSLTERDAKALFSTDEILDALEEALSKGKV